MILSMMGCYWDDGIEEIGFRKCAITEGFVFGDFFKNKKLKLIS